MSVKPTTRLGLCAALACLTACSGSGGVLRVGSKKFTESVVLGEILQGLLEHAELDSVHKRELGGTRILWSAMLAGELDLYVEYSGTLREELLTGSDAPADDTREALAAALARHGVRMGRPLGFDNTYAIGMRPDVATPLGISRISDLAAHPDLTFGFGNEFLEREDGWPSLAEHYGLAPKYVTGLDHDLAYRGLQSGAIDVMDMYSTDAEIGQYGLLILEDDLAHFPAYEALVLYRADLEERAPRAIAALSRLAGTIDEKRMIALNERAMTVSEVSVAGKFLEQQFGIAYLRLPAGRLARIGRTTLEHLFLVGVSLLSAILVAVPLGIGAALAPRLGRWILGAVGVVQTIPSLALFVFAIPLFGLGAQPAIVALFLYSLLPIVRGTSTGLLSIPREVTDSAAALGLARPARLRLVELPLATRSIIAGIQTSAVINVGTATLGALIGAGGYGQPILTGIRRDDLGTILEGAVPAAVLALVVQGLFEIVERRLLPRGLRLASEATG